MASGVNRIYFDQMFHDIHDDAGADELITTDDDPAALAIAIPKALRETLAITSAARAYLARRHSDREATAVLETAANSMAGTTSTPAPTAIPLPEVTDPPPN